MATESFEQMVSDIEKQCGKVADQAPEQLIEGFKSHQRASRHLQESFISDPLSYCSPPAYLARRDTLPQPLIFIESGNGFPTDSNFEEFFYIQNESNTTAQTILTFYAKTGSGTRSIIRLLPN
jgi:hypothetical protein